MNKEKVIRLADFIQRNKKRFDMMYTDRCIMEHGRRLFRLVSADVDDLADALDLTPRQTYELCYPEGVRNCNNPPTRKQAIQALRTLAETGEVRWSD
jgi:hypothetical protein